MERKKYRITNRIDDEERNQQKCRKQETDCNCVIFSSDLHDKFISSSIEKGLLTHSPFTFITCFLYLFVLSHGINNLFSYLVYGITHCQSLKGRTYGIDHMSL